jgi:phosphonate transport system substrate-binding protein
MSFTNKIRIVGLLLVIFTGFVACSFDKEEEKTSLKTIKVGVLPDESKKNLSNRYNPLMEHLSRETGFKFELFIPESYEDLLTMFHDGQVDLAYFGGFTFVKAHLADEAVPLVMRDVDARFSSYYIVKGDNPAKSISEFKDKIICFGSKLSTSGHLMPRFFLKEKEIIPENYFSEVRYSGSHDKTAHWVRDGTVDLGVANSQIINAMFKDGRLEKNAIRVLLETPPYANYIWAVQPRMEPTIQTKIRDAFLDLSQENEKNRKILNGLNATYFIPSSVEDFSRLKAIVENSRGF